MPASASVAKRSGVKSPGAFLLSEHLAEPPLSLRSDLGQSGSAATNREDFKAPIHGRPGASQGFGERQIAGGPPANVRRLVADRFVSSSGHQAERWRLGAQIDAAVRELPFMPASRRLTVTVSLDVMGFTRLVQEDERATLAEIAAIRRTLIDSTLQHRNGHMFKTMRDGALIEFPNVEDAVSWTVEFQEALAARSRGRSDKPILIRAGIALAEVDTEGRDRLDAAIASVVRLQEVAPPGGIAMTHPVRWQLRKALAARFTRIIKTLKGMDEPWEIWVWAVSGAADGEVTAAAPSRRLNGNGDQPPLVLDKPSIAVLPFENMSGDPEQEYFADGMVEEIITALSRVRAFFVIARNSSFAYGGTSVDLKQVGRELGVRHVLEGSLRRAGSSVRITGQLISPLPSREPASATALAAASSTSSTSSTSSRQRDVPAARAEWPTTSPAWTSSSSTSSAISPSPSLAGSSQALRPGLGHRHHEPRLR